ncbi:MAG: Crp/Fnr family transcriptional regulator [Bryobacteraceae bacterium]|nr:Crp/Fnr family transcriptional regulator [Bryobacteraceae bacterium]
MPKDPESERQTLRDHGSCKALTDLTLKHLSSDPSIGRRRRYLKGSEIWGTEDKADRLYMLQRGQVLILINNSSGHEVILRVVEPGQPFGELCFCAEHGGVRENCARAMTQCEAVELDFSRFLKYFEESRNALRELVFTLCTRLAQAERRIDVLSYRAAEDRLARLLLQEAKAKGTPSTKHQGEMTLPLSHEEIALTAAMSRPHVTVTMGRLRKLGLVDYGRDTQLRINIAAMLDFVTKPKRTTNR